MPPTITSEEVITSSSEFETPDSTQLPSPLENSQLLERVSRYQLVTLLYTTTRDIYNKAKDSHQMVKTGLEKAEETIVWANSQPPVVRAEQAILSYVDGFGNRQLDRLDNGVDKARELYNADYITAAKTKGSTLLQTGKEFVETRVIQPGRETLNVNIVRPVQELRSKPIKEVLEPVRQRVVPVAQDLSCKTLSLANSGAKVAYSKSLIFVDRVLQPREQDELVLSYLSDELNQSLNLARIRHDATVVRQRLQGKLLQQLKNLNLRIRTPERIEQLRQNSVNLLTYASNYLDTVTEAAQVRLKPIRARLPTPPSFVSSAVESARSRLSALSQAVWSNSRIVLTNTSRTALSYVPPSVVTTVTNTKNSVIDFVYDVPLNTSDSTQQLKSNLNEQVKKIDDVFHRGNEVFQHEVVVVRNKVDEVVNQKTPALLEQQAAKLEQEAGLIEEEAVRLEEETEEVLNAFDNKQDDQVDTDQE